MFQNNVPVESKYHWLAPLPTRHHSSNLYINETYPGRAHFVLVPFVKALQLNLPQVKSKIARIAYQSNNYQCARYVRLYQTSIVSLLFSSLSRPLNSSTHLLDTLICPPRTRRISAYQKVSLTEHFAGDKFPYFYVPTS